MQSEKYSCISRYNDPNISFSSNSFPLLTWLPSFFSSSTVNDGGDDEPPAAIPAYPRLNALVLALCVTALAAAMA